jgi:glutathione-regulated potassium-efflux system protein KefB
MGEEREDAARLVEEFRDRDEERFAMEVVGGIYAGRSLIRGNSQPADLVAARTARERAEREKAEAAEE